MPTLQRARELVSREHYISPHPRQVEKGTQMMALEHHGDCRRRRSPLGAAMPVRPMRLLSRWMTSRLLTPLLCLLRSCVMGCLLRTRKLAGFSWDSQRANRVVMMRSSRWRLLLQKWRKQDPRRQDGRSVLLPHKNEATSPKPVASNLVPQKLPLPSHSFVGTSSANDGATLSRL